MGKCCEQVAPAVTLGQLKELWFQVGGTLCNLTCHHCFISCSPKNDSFGFLTLPEVKRHLREASAMGVEEYYFTGGEPFLNRDLVPILIETLRYGPATVLTNGTVLKDEWLAELRAAEEQGEHPLNFRVSIDGFSAETNDPIRGEGTFVRAMAGVRQLVEHGFEPIITATRTWPEADDDCYVSQFIATLKLNGYEHPKLKLLPQLRLGAEAERSRPYHDCERITAEMMANFDARQLLCEHSRMVTDRGVYVCPILIDSPDARLGDSLSTAKTSFALSHQACYTCYQHGSICSNASGQACCDG